MSNRHPNDFPVDPYVVNGGVLAERLTRLVESLDTRESGYARPSYAQRGTIWLDESNIIGSPSTIKMMVFDGTHDVLLHEVNVDSGEVIGGGGVGGRAWDDLQQYKTGDVVTEATFLYIAIQDSTGSAPSTHPSDWLLFDIPDYDGVIPYADVAALRDAPTGIDSVAYLSQDGRAGNFIWSSTNHSADVTADTQSGIYVAPSSDLTGASGAWVREYSGAVNVKWFGAVAGVGVDNTAAVQAAHDVLDSAGGEIYFPATGTAFASDSEYRCDGTITTTKPIMFRGDRHTSSVLAYTGSGLFIDASTTTYSIAFENITITGVEGASGEYFVAGSVGVDPGGNVQFTNSRIARFSVAFAWSDAYYHKFSDSMFNRCGKFFERWTCNNVAFSNCSFRICDVVFEFAHGTANLNFRGCSFESITTACITSVSNATAAIEVSGCYFENSPEVTGQLALGLAKDSFDSASGFLNCVSTLSFTGSFVNMPGFARFINMSGATVGSIDSVGNRLWMDSGDTTFSRYATMQSLLRGNFSDFFDGAPSASYTHYVYFDKALSNLDAISIIDPVTGEDVSPIPAPVSPTLLNGWVVDTSVGNTEVGYRKSKGWVTLNGSVDGNSATNQIIFTLPEGFRPAGNVYFNSHSWDGSNPTIRRLRVTPAGSVILEGAFGTGVINVPLDMVRFVQD